MIINMIQESCVQFFPINLMVNYYLFCLKILIFLKEFNSDFLNAEMWFTHQNCKLIQIEDKININLFIN